VLPTWFYHPWIRAILAPARRAARRRRSVSFELLECRLCPAHVIASLVAGNLDITGTGDNSIAVDATYPSQVRVAGNGVDQGPFDVAGSDAGVSYLDLYWQYFRGRPYALAGVDGFASTQPAPTGHTFALAAYVPHGATMLPLGSGEGASFTPGELIDVGSPSNDQSLVVVGVVGDELQCAPALAAPGGYAAGTAVQFAWLNTGHPSDPDGYLGWAQAIVNARLADGLAGTNLVSSGNMETTYTDANQMANVPTGWVSVGAAHIAAVTPVQYEPTAYWPRARSGLGTSVTTRTADQGGVGLETAAAIAVQPAASYVLSANVWAVTGGAPVVMRVVDADSRALVAASEPLGTPAAAATAPKVSLVFQAPAGTSNVLIQFVTAAGGRAATFYVDGVRLVAAPVGVSSESYLLQDSGTQPIVVLGDSWAVLGFTALQHAIEQRFPNVQVINAGVGGNTLNMMAARFATDVLPYKPAYVILGTGMMNDLADGRTLADMQADLSSIIAQARAAGIRLIIPGVAPTDIPSVSGGLPFCSKRNDELRTVVDQAAVTHEISIRGAAGNDTFTIDLGAGVTGLIDGGVNALDLSSRSGGTGSETAVQDIVSWTGRFLDLANQPVSRVSLSAANATMGTPTTFTVSARDALNNVKPGHTGAVRLVSSAPQATLPKDYTFMSSENGVHTFMGVGLGTAGTQKISAQDTGTPSFQGSTSVTITAAAAGQFPVAYPAQITAGNLRQITITAQDPYGNTGPTYRGMVHLTSRDRQALVSPDATFAGDDNGVHTFSAALFTAGPQTITATDTQTGAIVGTETIAILPAAINALVVSGFPSLARAGSIHDAFCMCIVLARLQSGKRHKRTVLSQPDDRA
jgi:hypothetical protein